MESNAIRQSVFLIGELIKSPDVLMATAMDLIFAIVSLDGRENSVTLVSARTASMEDALALRIANVFMDGKE